ncbi:zeta toxin family protein [Variovorax sp. VaC1]|uniref:zeta toxin family protein n=1 Tax=Variovorax sp. VaC1 TaxID=3373132 RepID=UPI003749B5B0
MDRQEHRLSEADNERIFQQDIRPYLMATASGDLQAQAEPTMVMVGGQPGAGKSRSIDSVKLDLESHGGVMEISADDLRKFHPKHDELMRADDRTAADFTHADASAWAEKAERFAREERYNVLLEGTMKTPENAAAKFAEYKEAGYFIEARVIAVHERASWQGVLGRYEQQKADAGVGRMTPKDVHDAAVSGVLRTVEKIETEQLVDRLRVDRRGAEQIYSNTAVDGAWQHPPGARQAIEGERDRPLSAKEWDAHVAGFDRIDALQQRHGRNATADEMNQVRELRAGAAIERDRAALKERDAEASAAFRSEPPELAVAKHPRLALAYAALEQIEQHARRQGVPAAQLDAVKATAREQIAERVQAGHYPAQRDITQERPAPTKQREPER